MQKFIKSVLASYGSGNRSTPAAATSIRSNSNSEIRSTFNDDTASSDTSSVDRSSNGNSSDGEFDMDKCFEVGYKSSQRVASVLLQALKTERGKNKIRLSDRLQRHTHWNCLIEDMLVNDISKHYPTHKFVTKNRNKDRDTINLTDEPTWFIDPLGSPKNFSHGFPFANINLAFWLSKKPRFGIIWNPLKDECYTARDGYGAYMNVNPLRVSKCTKLEDALIMIECKTKSMFEPSQIARHRVLATKVDSVRSLGSNTLSMCMVANGVADAYIDFNSTTWDMSAAILLVKEAGGVVWDPSLKPFDIMSHRVLCACSQELAEKLSALINETQDIPSRPGESKKITEVWDKTVQKLRDCKAKVEKIKPKKEDKSETESDDESNKVPSVKKYQDPCKDANSNKLDFRTKKVNTTMKKEADKLQTVRSSRKKCKQAESEDDCFEMLNFKEDQDNLNAVGLKNIAEVREKIVEKLRLCINKEYKTENKEADELQDCKESTQAEVLEQTDQKLDLSKKKDGNAKDKEVVQLQSVRSSRKEYKQTENKDESYEVCRVRADQDIPKTGDLTTIGKLWREAVQKLGFFFRNEDKPKIKKADKSQSVGTPKKKSKLTESQDECNVVHNVIADQDIQKAGDLNKRGEVREETGYGLFKNMVYKTKYKEAVKSQSDRSPRKNYKQIESEDESNEVHSVIADQDTNKSRQVRDNTVRKLGLCTNKKTKDKETDESKDYKNISPKKVCKQAQSENELNEVLCGRTDQVTSKPVNSKKLSGGLEQTKQKHGVSHKKDDKAKYNEATQSQNVKSPRKPTKREDVVCSVKAEQGTPKSLDLKTISKIWLEIVQNLGFFLRNEDKTIVKKADTSQSIRSPNEKSKPTEIKDGFKEALIVKDRKIPKIRNVKKIAVVRDKTVKSRNVEVKSDQDTLKVKASEAKGETAANDKEAAKLQSARSLTMKIKKTKSKKESRQSCSPKIVYALPKFTARFYSPSTRFSGCPKSSEAMRRKPISYPTDPILPGQINLF
ncbi:hypothetical protein KR093_010112 [Drosophila rubida]|uniref:Inositol-phosphate phosphatase n=1 Tax=Drosophila rubida TaxID=30044 RepID=A0AAD4K1Y7_9MUSC|nr:hypothetical protein KR093_010112 [Drosophila rubida]